MNNPKECWFPTNVSGKRIRFLGRKIRPIVKFGRARRFIQPVDLFEIAFTWDPEPAEYVKGLKPLCDITTYHTFSYQGFFKPSIHEVLVQIPKEFLPDVVAFEIVKSPDTVDDLMREIEATNAGYHVATTRLYTRA